MRPKAKAGLVALPYAGGSSAMYRPWDDRLPGAIELLAVQLPGRGGRIRDPFPDTLPELVGQMAEGLASFLDKPYAVFGHSMGALLGFELCRALRAIGAPTPRALIAAGSPGPRYRARWHTSAYQLPDEQFARILKDFSATPPELLANEEFMRLALPMLRYDFRLCETYVYRPDQLLALPIVVIGGDDDPFTYPEPLKEWSFETTAQVKVCRVRGGHFFVNTSREEVIDLVVREAFSGIVDSDDVHGPTPA